MEMNTPTNTQTLADAVMPDNTVQSVTQTLMAEDAAAQAAQTATQVTAEQTAAAEAVNTVPVSYELKLPEGYYLSDDMRGEFTSVAQQYGLTNEAANALVDLHIKQVQAGMREMESRVADKRAEYERATRQDPEIGGSKFESSLISAKNALNRYGNKALIDMLNETGLGSHPEVIRAFAKIGAAMGEGRYVAGTTQQQPAEKTLAQKIYGV